MGADSDAYGSRALSEGRRIYLGNLPYTVTAEEMEQGLQDHGFGDFEAVHMSVDDMTSRNPGYCFVDFRSREEADRALDSLRATIHGRTLKVGPCRPKRPVQGFSRWGSAERQSLPEGDETAASSTSSSRRLYVGGLGGPVDEAQNTGEVTQFFTGYKLTSIGERIAPHDSKAALPGNHHYCFVELETPEQAHAAMEALDGKDSLRVSLARPPHQKTRPGFSSSGGGGRGRRDHHDTTSPAEPSPRGARSLASDNWRRRND